MGVLEEKLRGNRKEQRFEEILAETYFQNLMQNMNLNIQDKVTI